jgi:hypothetical protein
MSLVSGTRGGRKVYANVLLRQPNPDVGGQINDSVRRTRREQFRVDRVDRREGRNFAIRFSVGQEEFVAAKECGGRGEKEFFDESFESIKKLLKGSAAGQVDGRQAEDRRSCFEGR